MANKILCICGSARFTTLHNKVAFGESLAGWIVVGFASTTRESYKNLSDERRSQLARLHLDKIRMCHQVLFLNENGYVGDTGKHQLAFAISQGKSIRFYDEQLGNGYLEAFAKDIAHLANHYLTETN